MNAQTLCNLYSLHDQCVYLFFFVTFLIVSTIIVFVLFFVSLHFCFHVKKQTNKKMALAFPPTGGPRTQQLKLHLILKTNQSV